MSWPEEWPAHRARLMAAAMQPIEKQVHDAQLWRELSDYLSELNEHDDELKCQFTHTQTVCATSVVYKGVGCVKDAVLCATAGDLIREWMENPATRCASCGRPASHCWRLWPI